MRLRVLASAADIFTQSYRSGTLTRRGLGSEELAALRRGYDRILQSTTGMAHASGDVAGPRLLPVSATDYGGGG